MSASDAVTTISNRCSKVSRTCSLPNAFVWCVHTYHSLVDQLLALLLPALVLEEAIRQPKLGLCSRPDTLDSEVVCVSRLVYSDDDVA
jgi:hypothetical protein